MAAPFEGKVVFNIAVAPGQPTELRQTFKSPKIRMEMAGTKGAMIFDTAKKETTILIDDQKLYMVATPPPNLPAPAQPAGEAPTLEKTGKSEKIAGHTAEQYISTSQGAKTELWLAEGLGSFSAPTSAGPQGNSPIPSGWEKALAGKELFPLRVVGHDAAGKETFKLEVTSIEKQSVPDSAFEPPAGYQKLDMSAMRR